MIKPAYVYLKIIALILTISVNSFAQNHDISILRTEDNNLALKADSTDWKFHTAIKEIQMSKNDLPKISLGGEVRQYYQYNASTNFGDLPPGWKDNYGYLSQRYMLHADAVISKYIRAFVQLTSNHVNGKEILVPEIEKNVLDIHQAFVDLRFDVGSNLFLRVGKQELDYGKDRMISMREGPNVRLSYGGIKAGLYNTHLKTDIFIVRPSISNPGIFDDQFNLNELIYGAYSNYVVSKDFNFDFYYIGADRKNALYWNQVADENRHSLGGRLNKSLKNLTLDLEATYQFGKWGQQNISAFQIVSSNSYRFDGRIAPAITAEYYLQSGDKSATDNENNTFRAISAKPSTSPTFAFAASNNHTIVVEAGISPFKRARLNARYMAVWLFSQNDVVYTPDNGMVMRGLSNGSSFYGQGISTYMIYALNKHFYGLASLEAVIPGEYAKQTGKGEIAKNFSMIIGYKF